MGTTFPPQSIFLIVLTLALPIAWIVADIRGRPATRRTVGVIALLWSFGVAALVGSMEHFNANAYYSAATKELLEVSVQQLRSGNSQVVLREWTRANEQLHATYENRGNYQEIAQQAVKGMTNR